MVHRRIQMHASSMCFGKSQSYCLQNLCIKTLICTSISSYIMHMSTWSLDSWDNVLITLKAMSKLPLISWRPSFCPWKSKNETRSSMLQRACGYLGCGTTSHAFIPLLGSNVLHFPTRDTRTITVPQHTQASTYFPGSITVPWVLQRCW